MKRLFIADLHIDEFFSKKIIERFFMILSKEKPDEVYILGDLFNIGIQYKIILSSTIKKVVRKLKKYKNVYFLPGNHDLWINDLMVKSGIKVINEGYLIKEKNIKLYHYVKNVVPSLFKNKLFIAFITRFPPPIAPYFFEILSYTYFLLRKKIVTNCIKKIIEEKEKKGTITIMAHIHKQYDGKQLFILGDFRNKHTYLIETKGKILRRYARDFCN